MKQQQKIHFIGIGGSSMNGLALLMKSKGHIITGSDNAKSPFTELLEQNGIPVIIGQRKENIKDYDLVIHTAAISDTNEELMEARKRGIPTMDRAAFLGELSKEFKTSVGVAGCHGKTTITSMIGLIAMRAELDPTVHVGAVVPFLGSGGTRIGGNDTLILEACEYEDSYLKFNLNMAVINNIDNDHLNYFGSIENIEKSFLTFAKQLPKDGVLVANYDDERVRRIAGSVNCSVETYGLSGGAKWQAKNIAHHATGETTFDVFKDGEKVTSCNLKIPGEHNIQNALAAIVVCEQLGVPVFKSCEILKEYRLTKRRFEYYGKVGTNTLIHDYAHHPTEIAACIKTAQPLPHEKLVGIFQCHTFSRAINHLNEFGDALKNLDLAIITDIYPARETDEGKIHAKDIVDMVNKKGGNAVYIADFNGVKEYLKEHPINNSIILAMGAGDIGEKVKVLLDK